MSEFKEGMICFSRPLKPSFIQKCISFFTGSPFTHSFVVINDNGILKALETTSTKVICDAAHLKFFEDNHIECWEASRREDRYIIKQLSYTAKKDYLGKWYAYQSYLWFIFRFFARKFNKEPKRMWAWCSKLWIFCITCTELTCKSLPSYLHPDQDINGIAPKELRDYFINNPNLMVKTLTIFE